MTIPMYDSARDELEHFLIEALRCMRDVINFSSSFHPLVTVFFYLDSCPLVSLHPLAGCSWTPCPLQRAPRQGPPSACIFSASLVFPCRPLMALFMETSFSCHDFVATILLLLSL